MMTEETEALRAGSNGEFFPVSNPSPPSVFGLSIKQAAAMLLLALMLGLAVPVTKLGLDGIPPFSLTALRFLIAVPLFMLMARGRLWVPREAWPDLAGLGVMGIVFGNVAQTLGVQGTSAAAGTIISATMPVFTVILAAWRFGQAVTPRQWSGLLAAFAGIGLVAMGSGRGGEASTTTIQGVAWMLLSAVAIAWYYIRSAELSQKYGTLAVATWNALAGLIAILPLAAWELGREPMQPSAQALWAVAYLGVVVTVAGLLLWLYLLKTVPARLAASVQYLQPVFGMVAATFMFGDPLGSLFGAGVLLILAGLVLAAARGRSR